MNLAASLANIRIVLVNPSDPGNIGAAARALKNMGLKQLYLVNPKAFPHPSASIRASNALDILADCKVVRSLEYALKDCHVVFGTSTRQRELQWVCYTARQAASKIAEFPNKNIAVLFGRERSGLTNEELQHCHFQMTIPANPHYNSLNLAAAVQIVCYELREALINNQNFASLKTTQLANLEQLTHFYRHLEKILQQSGFLQSTRSQNVMDRLRRLFGRSNLDETEVRILRGILSTIEKKIV